MADFFRAQPALDHEMTVPTLELLSNQDWQSHAFRSGLCKRMWE